MTCLTNDLLSFSKKSRHQKHFARKPAINMPFLCDHRYIWIKSEYFPEAIPWHSRSKPRASESGHLGVSQFLFPLFSERSWPPVSVWLLQLPVRIFPGSVFLSTIRGWNEALFSLPTGAPFRPDIPALQARLPLSALAPAPLPSRLDSQLPQDWKPRSPNTPACASQWEPGSLPLYFQKWPKGRKSAHIPFQSLKHHKLERRRF